MISETNTTGQFFCMHAEVDSTLKYIPVHSMSSHVGFGITSFSRTCVVYKYVTRTRQAHQQQLIKCCPTQWYKFLSLRYMLKGQKIKFWYKLTSFHLFPNLLILTLQQSRILADAFHFLSTLDIWGILVYRVLYTLAGKQ